KSNISFPSWARPALDRYTSSACRRLHDFHGIGNDIDFDLLEALQQSYLELNEKLAVFRGIVHVHDDARRNVFVANSFVQPGPMDRMRRKGNSFESFQEFFAGLIEVLVADGS